MKNRLVLIVVTIFCGLSASAQVTGGPSIVDEKGMPVRDGLVLVKGRPLTLAAKVAPTDAGVPAVVWTSQPEGVLELKDEGGGRVRVTALRDWFDEKPGKEPTGRVTACVGTLCLSVAVVCLIDVAGRWPARLLEGFFRASENRDLVFVQDGRFITFDPEPFNPPDPQRVATMRLEGASLRLVKSGNVITRFDGALTDRSTGNGNWASKWGFSGTWTARKVR